MSRPLSRPLAWAYGLSAALLALTGVMQMPIASRYRIVAVPGLAWLGNFWLTHRLHYLGAILLLALAGYALARWLREWRRDHALTAYGMARAGLIAALVASGAVRMLKNLPGLSFDPGPTMLVDITHLALAALLGLVALARVLAKGAYVRPR